MNAENERKFTTRTLAIFSVAFLAIGVVGTVIAAIAGLFNLNAAAGADTPIVIMGGSIHFRARNNQGWQPCTPESTTCYMAVSDIADKKKLKYYHLRDENFKDSRVKMTAAAKGTGWEIDIVDQKQQVIKVCAEISDSTTCDNKGLIRSNYIYVINTGSGSFDKPTGPNGGNNRLVYHNKVGADDYAYITTIRLNASDDSPTEKNCSNDDYDCNLVLSNKWLNGTF